MNPIQKNNITLKRLKSKIIIDRLFKQGEVIHTKHLMLRILKKEDPILYAGVSVAKRNFKRAVDRNKIKRQLREVLKSLEEDIPYGGSCMLIHKGRSIIATKDLLKQGKQFFEKE